VVARDKHADLFLEGLRRWRRAVIVDLRRKNATWGLDTFQVGRGRIAPASLVRQPVGHVRGTWGMKARPSAVFTGGFAFFSSSSNHADQGGRKWWAAANFLCRGLLQAVPLVQFLCFTLSAQREPLRANGPGPQKRMNPNRRTAGVRRPAIGDEGGLARRVTTNDNVERVVPPLRFAMAKRYSSGHTEGLSRTRCCFCIRLAERSGLLGKRTHLRLHELSLNSKNLLKVLGLAQLAHTIGGS